MRIVAEDWRGHQIARLGLNRWKGVYSVVSAVGLALMAWGYGMSRAEPVALWEPPPWTHHVAALLTLPALVLLVAAYLPGSRIRAAVGHPMVAGVKLWAIAHLLANGRLGDVLLFGAFLVWAVFDFRAARGRDRMAGMRLPPGTARGDVVVLLAGMAVWAMFAFLLHGWLFGVEPFA